MEALLESCAVRSYKSFADLKVGDYPVRKFGFADTKHGKRLRVDLTDFYVFLPERFQIENFPPSRIEELNSTDIILEFKGKEPGANGRYVDIF